MFHILIQFEQNFSAGMENARILTLLMFCFLSFDDRSDRLTGKGGFSLPRLLSFELEPDLVVLTWTSLLTK